MQLNHRSVVVAKYNAVVHYLVMYYSVCGLKWLINWLCRHGCETYLAQYLHLFQVRLLETKVFPHHRIRFTFLPDQRLPSSTVSVYTVFFAESENLQAGKGRSRVHRWKWKGLLYLPHKGTACGRMIVLLRLSCFCDRGKPKSKLKLKFN